jgi:RNase P/RNase MRP subunit POP5
MHMKPVKPSHRENKRYLQIKGKNANKKEIEECILEFIGVLGFAEACPRIIKENENQIILAINRSSLNKVRAAFLIGGKDLKIVRVSGTIKKLGEKKCRFSERRVDCY